MIFPASSLRRKSQNHQFLLLGMRIAVYNFSMSNAEAVFNPVTHVHVPSTGTTGSCPSPLQAFTGTIQPNKVTVTYTIGLAIVALGMLLLTVSYIGLIGLAGYGGWYHIAHNADIMRGSGGGFIKLFLYIGPAVAAVTLIFFMIKPFFAARPQEPSRYSLTRESDPVLFAFIDKICELVKAPLPSRVDVDCQVNASASFRRGLSSITRNDLALTIGLPLVEGMTMQEFGGVLAHEFGHFTQGAGMRLTYFIRTINNWFARVVYERDEWDIKLSQAASGIDIRIGIFIHFTRLCIWLTRRILWVLMHIGHAMSCFMLRQMEYDADSYETKLAGSNAFAATTAKLRSLSLASQFAYHEMQESWRNRRLPENLPLFINVSTNSIPPDVKAKVEEASAKTKTGIFDTHPADADRIRAAQALSQPGVFHLDEAATNLFNDFVGLSKTVTRFHYEHNLELKFTENNLVPQEVAVKESKTQAENHQALHDYFFGLKLTFRPLIFSKDVLPATPVATLIENVKNARLAMEQSKTDVQQALVEYEQAENLYQRGLNAIVQTSQQATTKADATKQTFIPALAAFEQQAQIRLTAALQLLNAPEIAANINEASSLQQEAATLAVVFARLSQAFVPLQELRRKFNAFSTMLQTRGPSSSNAKAEQRISELAPELENLIKQIRESVQGIPYPFKHAREEITIDEFARSDIPATHKLEALYNNCSCQLTRLLPLYHRVLSRLAFIALQVESKL
ncbi:MAG: heat shock protein HtpX [Pedosphaera sp.]|nr:heat shock protein HtpX [Pedosphaera sp.]